MNVLVACEESQTLTNICRKFGVNAFSCDLLPCSGGHPEYHIVGDVRSILHHDSVFITEAGIPFSIDHWDIMVGHPPCTYLTKAGAVRLFDSNHNIRDKIRFENMINAARLFFDLLNADIPHICIENPTPLKIAGLPTASQVIEPYYFGDPYTKRTCLWLKGLPYLPPSDVFAHKDGLPSFVALHGSAKQRSKSFPGIANAMFRSWIAPLCGIQII